jgi:hypothetical protein
MSESEGIVDFKPYKRVIENIPYELKRAAQTRKIPVSKIDIDLTAVTTLYRTKKDSNWAEATKEVLKKLEHPKYKLMSTLQIKQQYELIFRPTINRSSLDLDFKITTDKFKSQITANVSTPMPLPRHPKLGNMLLKEINKKKLKLGLVINIYDSLLKAKIREIVTAVTNGEEVSNFDIIMCQCSAPSPAIDDDIIEHYKINNQKENEESGDRSDRGFAIGVYTGEIILEYQKPLEGENGRDCLGAFIKSEKPLITHKPTFKPGDGIDIDENETRILYKAAMEGSVVHEPLLLDVTDKIKVQSATFRGTGTINVGKDKDIKLEIGSKDEMQDSIASGVRVECTELNVTGVVGAGAEVYAKVADVQGMTHAKAFIEVDETAHIAHHRGKLIAKEAKIDSLEGGKVKAEIATITKANGGEIEAQKIFITELGSNTIIKASETIEVDFISGDGNKLIIDPSGVADSHSKLEGYTLQLKQLDSEMISIMEEYNYVQKDVMVEKEWLTQLKQMLAKKEIMLLPVHKIRMKSYQLKEEKLKDLQLIIDQTQQKQRTIREEIMYYDTLILKAKVHSKAEWKSGNKVRFIHPQAEEPYVLTPKPKDNEIMLAKIEEGEYQLVTTTTIYEDEEESTEEKWAID